jgi:hypothetical protein
MEQPDKPQLNLADPLFIQQVHKLHRLTVYGRWLFSICSWLVISPFCLWDFRGEISLLLQYFTWVALRYALISHPFSTLGLSFCVAVTTSVLIWQSRNILLGLPLAEKQRLEKQVLHIRQQGSTHPLWKWISQLEK